MICELKDTQKAAELFLGWEETLITSCLQKVMGKIWVTDPETVQSACADVGCFLFYAGVPNRELLMARPEGFRILVPENHAWGELIEACYPESEKVVRYAIRKDTVFDREHLKRLVKELPEGYEIRGIDGDLYEKCRKESWSRDFVSNFEDRKTWLSLGRGKVVLKDGEPVAGASSYTRYREGIEIEVDTREDERQKHLATAVCASLILNCLEEGLYPSWDAQNRISVRLCKKLGYTFSHEYPAFVLWQKTDWE